MASADINTVLAYNTTIINGNRITTGTIDVARLNITGGTAGVNGFVVDGNGIRAYNASTQTLNIASDGTVSLGDSSFGWTVDRRYITSRNIFTAGYTKLVLDGYDGSITGGRISGTSIEGNTITGNTITGGTIIGSRVQTSSSTTRVELRDVASPGTDSLRALISGVTVGHVFGYGTSTNGGMVMMSGSTANPDTTSGHVRVLPNYAVLAGDSLNYFEANGTSNNINLRGQTIYAGPGKMFYSFATVSTTAPNFRIDSDGGMSRTSGSTIRIKEDVVDLLSLPSLDPSPLYSLPVRAFKFKKDIIGPEDQRYDKMVPGFIAEEVAEIYPAGVDIGDDGLPENWNFRVIVPAMLSLIQDLNQRVKELEG